MIVGRLWQVRLLTAAVAGAAAYMPAAWARTTEPSNAELADLVKEQARQIKRLNERIAELEDHRAQRQSARSVPRQSRASPTRQTARQSDDDQDRDLASRVARLEDKSVAIDWSSGAPEFSSPDGKHSFRLGGRLQYDVSSTFGSGYKGQSIADTAQNMGNRNITGTEFRRVRLGVSGKLMEPVLYTIQADFAGGGVSLKNAFLGFTHDFGSTTGTLYLGNKFADRGMDARTSSKWTWFTERGTVANAIAPASAYSLGATAEFVGDGDWHATLGLYKGTASKSRHTHSDDMALIGRTHWTPIHAADDQLLHLGFNASYERLHNRDKAYSKDTTLGTHYNSNLKVSSDAVLDPRQSYHYGVELAALYGPLAFGGEWGQRFIESHRGHTMTMSAYNLQAGLSLTGEPFGYDDKLGTFSRPSVENSVFKGGLGTWQLVSRFQSVDFENSAAYRGGSGHGASVGLDWYLNSLVRTIFEYSRWHTNNNGQARRNLKYVGADDGNTIQGRIQVLF